MFEKFIEHPQVRSLVALLKRLTDAPDAVSDEKLRTRLRIMNTLLLFITLSVTIGLVGGWFYVSFTPLVVATLSGFYGLYLLNKLGHFTFVNRALRVVLAIAPKLIWLNGAAGVPIGEPEILVSWTILASTICYFTFTMRQMLIMVALSEATMLAALLIARVGTTQLTASLYVTLSVDVLLLIAASLRERSERVIAQQAQSLEQERSQMKTLLEAAQEAIIMHTDGIIMMVNPACEKMLGYTRDELIGKPVISLIAEADREQAATHYTLDDDRPYELRGVHRDGRIVTLEIAGRSQYFDGERVRFVSMRDITERKVEQLRNIELAVEQEKVRILQKFISDISHDLRTPLSVINTSIYLIEKLANNPQRQQAQIEVLQGQASQVQRLLEDLITMSRLDKADTSDFTYRYLDIHDLIAQIVSDSQNDALRKRQRLAFRPSERSSPSVFVDPVQIKRMMRYLILNGVTYTPAGGEIVVSTICEPTTVIISIRDSGPGIPEHKLPYIFDQFYRGDEARGGDGGTGLGLTIARKIAQAHSGSITVQSKVGEGSDFRITLPIPTVSPI